MTFITCSRSWPSLPVVGHDLHDVPDAIGAAQARVEAEYYKILHIFSSWKRPISQQFLIGLLSFSYKMKDCDSKKCIHLHLQCRSSLKIISGKLRKTTNQYWFLCVKINISKVIFR